MLLIPPGVSEVKPARPGCEQIYNIFSLADPFAYRLEPLLDPSFERIPVVHLPTSAAGCSPGQRQRLRECLSMEAIYKATEAAATISLSSSFPLDSPINKYSSVTPSASYSEKTEELTLSGLFFLFSF